MGTLFAHTALTISSRIVRKVRDSDVNNDKNTRVDNLDVILPLKLNAVGKVLVLSSGGMPAFSGAYAIGPFHSVYAVNVSDVDANHGVPLESHGGKGSLTHLRVTSDTMPDQL